VQVCENHDADKVAEVERMVNEGSINLYHLAGGGAAELADTTRWRAPGEIAQRGMRRKAGGAADAAAAAAAALHHQTRSADSVLAPPPPRPPPVFIPRQLPSAAAGQETAPPR